MNTTDFATACIQLLKLELETRPGTEPYKIHTSSSFRSIVELFNAARNNQPCVVILNSFESVRLDTDSEREGVEHRLLTEIVVQLEGTYAPSRFL